MSVFDALFNKGAENATYRQPTGLLRPDPPTQARFGTIIATVTPSRNGIGTKRTGTRALNWRKV